MVDNTKYSAIFGIILLEIFVKNIKWLEEEKKLNGSKHY